MAAESCVAVPFTLGFEWLYFLSALLAATYLHARAYVTSYSVRSSIQVHTPFRGKAYRLKTKNTGTHPAS